MRVDVAKSGLERLSLSISARADGERVRRVLAEAGKEASPDRDSNLRWALRGGYRLKGTAYFVVLRLTHRDSHDLSIDLDYYESGRVILPRNLSTMARVLNTIEVEGEVFGTAQCDIEEGWRTPVDVPLRASDGFDDVFDQIRGVRLAKMDGGKVVESTILDIADADDGVRYALFHVVFPVKVSDKTPSITLERLKQLRHKMVTPIKEGKE